MQPRWLSLTHHRLLADPASDAALLVRYAEDRDSAAFECLLWRHGGLVLGTCERMLRDKHLAEDAYQATFLILARRAGTVRGLLPAWLHKVARRVCLRIRKRWPERLTADVSAPPAGPLHEHRETGAILDAEIAKLPEKHRRVVVLCYLQNLTAEAAARELGIPRGTVLSRLDTARRKLHAALTRRGIAPLAILAIPLIHAAPSAALVQATHEAAMAFISHAVITPITVIAHEVLQMTTRKWTVGTALAMITLAFASTGVGLFNAHDPAASQAVAQVPADSSKPVATKPGNPEEAKKLKVIEQQRQLEKLEVTELELKHRIDQLNARIAKEQSVREAEVNPRALQQAIDKIDQSMLEQEERLGELLRSLDEAKKKLRPEMDYKIKIGTALSNASVADRKALENSPEYAEYRKVSNVLFTNRIELEKLPGMTKTDEYAKLLAEEIKLSDEFADNTIPKYVKLDYDKLRKNIHSVYQQQVLQAQAAVDDVRNFPKTVAKRRAELVDRLSKASGVSEEQKLLEDEVQVLREFRKEVLRKKLTLKLEMEGIVLPTEPKK